jgi:G3E family GTPase
MREQNTRPKLILIGGFLGSGKTTLMMALGEELAKRGARVAVVTNDQGEFLVDTAYARSKGITAGEVLGGCFCCNFGELVGILENLEETEKPDYIFAEPVGSCTDLAATVLGPMKLYHDELVELGPYLVLADGGRMRGEYEHLRLEKPVTPREVLVAHQLKEASVLILSKDDLLTIPDRDKSVARLKRLVPGAEILHCSTQSGVGLEGIIAMLKDSPPLNLPVPVDIDYEVYAAAEAELGWYNGLVSFSSKTPFSPTDLAMDMMTDLKKMLGSDAAHAKILVSSTAGSMKVGLAGGRLQAESAIDYDADVDRVGLTLNIRSLGAPERLEDAARGLIEEAAGRYGLEESGYRSEALIPGAPKPTHRLS